MDLLALLQPLIGLAGILAFAYAISTNRKAISPRIVAWGFGLQVLFAVIVLKTDAGIAAFQWLGQKIQDVLHYSVYGSAFVFGPLGDQAVWAKVMNNSLGAEGAQYTLIFAFQILPTIIFIAALFAILYFLGVMQVVVRGFAVVMNKVMGASGAESLNVAASIFMGQTEAPLTIRPFLPRMTQSELMTVMTSGMAHISGGIMAAYIAFGIEARHLLTAVIMTAPGTLMMAKMFVPETEAPETRGIVTLEVEKTDVNIIDAAGRGTSEGLHLAMNVGAMLISFVAMIYLINGILGTVGLSMQMIFGWVFAPVAWGLGVPWKDAATVGNLLGTRMVLNEFIAFAQLGALAPTRRGDLARLGLRAMLAGTLANFVTAIIVGFLL